MKKLVFACLACLLAVSCNRFKSVETPIAGTKNLVTYTAENTSLVGIKAAGAETTLTAPLYVKAEAKYGYLIAQLGRQKADDPVKWALLDTEGQSVTGQTYDRVSYAPAYFMLENAAGKYYLKNGEKSAFGPYQDCTVSASSSPRTGNGASARFPPNGKRLSYLNRPTAKISATSPKCPAKSNGRSTIRAASS